jgi:predicted nucleic acid-binding protein
MIAIVDAGPLYAAADRSDQHHEDSVRILSHPEIRFFVPILAAAEAMYLVGRRLGPLAEAAFIEGLSDFALVGPTQDEWVRIADLVRSYRSFPLGAADASVIALAERLNTDMLVTFGHRHFRAVAPKHVASFRLLPQEPPSPR